jgi:uncharacterized protein
MEKFQNSTLTSDVVDDIFKFIDKKIAEGKKFKNLTLFGGEPLLKENYNIVEYIVKKAKRYNIRVDAVTNGYDLNMYFDLCKEEYINKLKLTLDGVGQVHNIRRKHVKDVDSFSKIIRNIDYIVKNTETIVELRGNISPDNIENVKELIGFYNNKGWLSNPRVFYYFKSLHACYENDDSKKMDDYVLGNMLEDEIKFNHVASYIRGEQIFSSFKKDYKIPKLSAEFCKASGELYVVDNERNVYPCWEMVNNPNNLIGTLENGGNFRNNEKYLEWCNRKSYKLSQCNKCPYVFLCCGDCPSHTYVSNGDICNTKCSSNKKVINECFLKAIEEMSAKV